MGVARERRIQSLALHLTYHRDRPEDQDGGVTAFRATVTSGRFADGTPYQTVFPELQNAWVAYQLRECQTLVLTSIWSWYLQQFEETYPTTHAELSGAIVEAAEWVSAGLDGSLRLVDARTQVAGLLSDGREIVDTVAPFTQAPGDHLGRWLALSFAALLAIDREASSDESGLAELRNDGGVERLSLAHMNQWLAYRNDQSVAETLAELIGELRLQHVRIATPKLSPTDQRDPFCFAEDNGILRFIRGDDPFWTGARFGVLNTMLWSLGLLESPTGDARLTELGNGVLDKVNANA